MLVILFLIFVSMQASESRKVVHVTVCAIQSRIFGSSSIKIKNLLIPLHIELLVFLAQTLILWNWTLGIGRFAWMDIAWICIEIANVSPWNCLFLTICAICWVGWN